MAWPSHASAEGRRRPTSSHTAFVFDEPAAFERVAARYLADGVASGHQVVYAAAGDLEPVRRELRRFVDLDDLEASGGVLVAALDDVYDRSLPASDQVGAYSGATQRSLEAGYRGLRAAVDVSALVRGRHDWQAFAGYEHRMDRAMADGLPFTAMCGYDRTRVEPHVCDTVGCLHPASVGDRAGVHLFRRSDGRLTVAGEVDATSVVWEAASGLVLLAAGHLGDEVVDVDAAELTFIDHRALLRLDESAMAAGLRVRVHAATPALVRVHALVPTYATELVLA